MYVQFFILFCIISSDDFFKLHSSFKSNGAYMVHINMHSFLPSQQSSFHALLQGEHQSIQIGFLGSLSYFHQA